MCNVQTVDPSDGSLRIAHHHGFRDPFLSFFERVSADSGAACGAALQRREMVVVENVPADPIFADQPSLDVLLEAGAHAVESIPFYAMTGRIAGVLSIHHQEPGPRSRRELLLLRLVSARLGGAVARTGRGPDHLISTRS